MLSDVLLKPAIAPDPSNDSRASLPSTDAVSADEARNVSSLASYKSETPLMLAGDGVKTITDGFGRVLWASANAALLASGTRCLTISDGKLCGRTRHSDAVIRGVISEAVAGQELIEELVAPSPNDAPQLYLRARPSELHAGAIAITIRELDRDLDTMPDLGRLFGLTDTEQEITRRIVQGGCVRQIAIEMNKAELTVRTHIKRLYVKMNVRTKEQLFAIVLKLMVD